MRFYLDENLSKLIAELGRRRGLDVDCSEERGNNQKSDPEQLLYAGRNGRCLVTRDRDFVALSREFNRLQAPHAGVLIVPRSIAGVFPIVVDILERYHRLYPGDAPPYLILIGGRA
ncbi:MAG: DUF5615 family PIN-like protein [Dehalococcoidia bacterium]